MQPWTFDRIYKNG